MTERIIWDKTPVKNGNSLGVILPIKIIMHLGLTNETPICIALETGKHGPFISIWKKEGE